MPTTNEVDDIRRKMAEIRLDMHRDIKSVRAGTEAATSWHFYVKHYPWAALGAAAVLGFVLVPRRHQDVKVVMPQVQAGETKNEKRRKKGLIAVALGFLGPIALRAAQGYAVNYLDTLMAQNPMQGPDLSGPASSPGRAAPRSNPGRGSGLSY